MIICVSMATDFIEQHRTTKEQKTIVRRRGLCVKCDSISSRVGELRVVGKVIGLCEVK